MLAIGVFVVAASYWIFFPSEKWREPQPGAVPPAAAELPAQAAPGRSPRPGTGEFAGWAALAASVAGGEKAPDGSTSASRLTEDATTTARGISATLNSDPSQPFTMSISAHQGNGRRLLLSLYAQDDGIQCDVDLDSGAVATRATGSGRVGNCSATQVKASGWWKVELAGNVSTIKTNAAPRVGIALTQKPFQNTYQGNGTGYILIYNAQIRQAPPTPASSPK